MEYSDEKTLPEKNIPNNPKMPTTSKYARGEGYKKDAKEETIPKKIIGFILDVLGERDS